MLDRGVVQEGSPYGLSVLEPAMPALYTILHMKHTSAELCEMKKKIEEGNAKKPTAEEVQFRIDVAEEARFAAEEKLRLMFRFPEEALPLDRSGLYLPGQERWTP